MNGSLPADVLALLDDLSAAGIELSVDGETLKVRAPAGALTPDRRAALAAHKPDLLRLLRGRPAAEDDDEPLPVPRGADLPLSSAQQRLWFVIQLSPESNPAYNIVAAVRMRGALHVPALGESLAELVRRHETLRTGFAAVEGRPVQRIHAEAPLPLPVQDLGNLPPEAQAAEVDRVLAAEGRTPFELQAPPLLRTRLLRLGPDHHVLVFVIHHLVSDDWSSGVIIREMGQLYEAFSAGQPSPLPPLPVQYVDYVAWHERRMQGARLASNLEYWTRTLGGVPPLDLPADHPRPPVAGYAGASERFVLPAALAARLRALSRSENATLFMTLLAAFLVLLQRYSGQTDIAVGTSIANRGRKSLEGLVGFLTNTLVLRTSLSGRPRFADLLARVREAARGAYEHQDLPFEQIVEALQPERQLSVNPLFQVCFSLLQAHRDALHLGGLTLERIDPPAQTSRFDLTLTLEDAREGLVGILEYSTDRFEAETMRRLVRHLGVLLTAIADAPHTPISELPLLPPEEEETVVHTWNATSTDYPRDACVHDLFAEVVRAHPERVAVVAGERSLTYAALDAASHRLARVLRARGVGPDVAVPICAERSLEMVVGLVAILKAGGFYMPFDPADPPDRLAYLIGQVHAGLVLAPRRHHPRLPAGVAVLDLETDPGAAEPAEPLPSSTHPDHLVYTTYTSGSTGLPKGIAIPHRGVVRLVRDTDYLRYEPSMVILEIAPVSFDASTFELWGALTSGACLVVMPPEVPSLRELGEAIARHGVTTLYLTSALFNLMVDERVGAFAGVRHLLVGGDAISVPHARKVLAAHPGLVLINGYGPTETTTFASCGILRRPEEVGSTVTIGRPISNTTIYMLDAHLAPVPIGIPGDLHIGGDGNARGYLDPGLTAAAFVPSPFGFGERLYRTGDRARWRGDGTAEFLGRQDNQVKLRGFRIELGEIENVLASHPGVQAAIVLVHEGREGPAASVKRLVAYVQPVADAPAPAGDWTVFLRERLPEYMVPSVFVTVDAFPLSVHNKVDRSALRRLSVDVLASPPASVAPRTPVEEVLAGLWREVLGVESVGVTDSFFDLGGHSLLATQLMWRVYDAFGVELPLRHLFESPTVAHFAAALEAAEPVPGRVAAIARIRQKVASMTPAEVEARLAGRQLQ